MHTAYLTHQDCLKYDLGDIHPESATRIHAINDQLIASGVLDYLAYCDAPFATQEQLARVHSEEYIEWIFSQSPSSGVIHLDCDTIMTPFSLNAALRAAGAVIKGIDLVMAGKVQNAFCNIRPPGHHASRDKASGFCIFNNVAVGAAHLLEQYGLSRVAILDFDVHHGDGTEAIFANESRVMFCSSFRHPFYPYLGAETKSSNIINVPLKAGTSGKEFRHAVSEHWFPALEKFRPEFILVSAGFDAHWEDDMGGLALHESDYRWITEHIKKLANEFSSDRIVSTLEGGYALHALGRSVLAHIKVLAEM